MSARILAHMPRLDAIRLLNSPAQEQVCACGTLKLGYLPERTFGRVTHGALVCFERDETEAVE